MFFFITVVTLELENIVYNITEIIKSGITNVRTIVQNATSKCGHVYDNLGK